MKQKKVFLPPTNRQFFIRLLILAILTFIVMIVQLPIEILAIKHLNTIMQIGIAIIYIIGFGAAIWLANKLFTHYNHFENKRITGKNVQLIIRSFLSFYAIEIVFGILNQFIYQQNQTANNEIIEKIITSNHLTFALMIISSVLLSPVLEELIFRGYFINAFFSPDKFWQPIIASGILFSLLHMHNLNIISFLTYGTLGAILAYAYKKTNNIRVSIGIHFLNNLFAMIMMAIQLLMVN